ncbi:RNA-directed DNA polymerase, eukaryota, reverse transcriptase zinc-binding domain protein [Tanacetum coccineum]
MKKLSHRDFGSNYSMRRFSWKNDYRPIKETIFAPKEKCPHDEWHLPRDPKTHEEFYTCTWSLGPNGTFTVKDARYRIDQNILPTLAHATTWDKSIPRKVNVFMWRLSLDRLPHRLNLSSRGMDIPAISCPSCNANVESANHIFFECDIATDMWKLVFRWCDIPLFQASSWDSFNDWNISWHASKEKKHRFYVITTSVLWWLWRYRNSVTFNSQPLRKSDLFDNVRFSSFLWLHNRDHMKLSWNDWLMFPLSIARIGNG